MLRLVFLFLEFILFVVFLHGFFLLGVRVMRVFFFFVKLSMYSKIRNRGLAFVTMGSPEEAVAALNNLESYVNTLSSILSFFGI